MAEQKAIVKAELERKVAERAVKTEEMRQMRIERDVVEQQRRENNALKINDKLDKIVAFREENAKYWVEKAEKRAVDFANAAEKRQAYIKSIEDAKLARHWEYEGHFKVCQKTRKEIDEKRAQFFVDS